MTKKGVWSILTSSIKHFLFLYQVFCRQKSSFKLYRMTGDSLLLLHRIKEFIRLKVLFLFRVRFEKIWILIKRYSLWILDKLIKKVHETKTKRYHPFHLSCAFYWDLNNSFQSGLILSPYHSIIYLLNYYFFDTGSLGKNKRIGYAFQKYSEKLRS